MNNLDMMRQRLLFQGGVKQEERMIHDKYKTFLKTLLYSYQGCDVQLAQKVSSCAQMAGMPIHRALINPDKVKQDYDDKILSIDYNAGFKPGDIFRWIGTDTYWLVYLPQLTEDAYFRSEIRLCKHQIKFKGADGAIYSTWAAIRGPVETRIQSIQKNQIQMDEPNWSLNILLPNNEITKSAFDRYTEFLFNGKCWRVATVDSISTQGILEISASEYYINRDTDDIEKEIKDGLKIEPVDPTPTTQIDGSTFIKPKIAERYSVQLENGQWSIDDKIPVELKIIDAKTVEVKWLKTTSGQFTLHWKKDSIMHDKVIVVESLF